MRAFRSLQHRDTPQAPFRKESRGHQAAIPVDDRAEARRPHNYKGAVMDVRNRKPVEEVVAAIQAMDLDPIKFKLMDREEGQGWSREQVDRVEKGYRRFLKLLVK